MFRLPAAAFVLCTLSFAVAGQPCSASLDLHASSYVRIGSTASMMDPDAMTCEVWFRARTMANTRLVYKGDGGSCYTDQSFSFEFGKTGGAGFAVFGGSRDCYFASVPGIVTPNSWIHFAGNWNSTTRMVEFWVDGKLVASKQAAPGVKMRQSRSDLTIGAHPPWGYELDGEIGFVRIWNRTLTGNEIAAFRFVEISQLPGIVHMWTFDGHLFDVKGNAHGAAVGPIGWQAGCATWMNYGEGTAGPYGVPKLTLDSSPVLGQTVRLVADNPGGASATGILVLGASPVTVALLGGVLLVEPTLLVPMPIGAGGGTLAVKIPNTSSVAGVPVFGQLPLFYSGNPWPAWSRGLQIMPGR